MPSNLELFHVFLALLAFLLSAHLGGFLFAKWRLPPVIGEIMGGVLLGPSVLGALAPATSAALFSEHSRVSLVLGMTYNFGSLLVLFCSGMGMGSLAGGTDRRLAWSLAICGSLLPLVGGYSFGYLVDIQQFMGPAQNTVALALVTAVAIAVTSLPVLTRIFADLGMLRSRFAKICLTASVLDDAILYVILAVALSLVSLGTTQDFGLLPYLLVDASLWLKLVVISAVNLGFLGFCALLARRSWLDALESSALGWIASRSPVAWLLSVLVAVTVFCLGIGIPMVLGAFCAGLLVAGSRRAGAEGRDAVERFSGGFFVPIYFALVGFRLDLGHEVDWVFFAVLLAFASLVKAASTYLGARLGGAEQPLAWDLAIVLNARGGPGIIVASVAFDAGIIDSRFYTALILLAIITSLGAGVWLRVRQRFQPSMASVTSCAGHEKQQPLGVSQESSPRQIGTTV